MIWFHEKTFSQTIHFELFRKHKEEIQGGFYLVIGRREKINFKNIQA